MKKKLRNRIMFEKGIRLQKRFTMWIVCSVLAEGMARLVEQRMMFGTSAVVADHTNFLKRMQEKIDKCVGIPRDIMVDRPELSAKLRVRKGGLENERTVAV